MKTPNIWTEKDSVFNQLEISVNRAKKIFDEIDELHSNINALKIKKAVLISLTKKL